MSNLLNGGSIGKRKFVDDTYVSNSDTEEDLNDMEYDLSFADVHFEFVVPVHHPFRHPIPATTKRFTSLDDDEEKEQDIALAEPPQKLAQLTAHKFILVNSSPVFASMFKGKMLEANPDKFTLVPIEDVSYAAFSLFLKCLYASALTVPGNCRNKQKKLLHRASRFQRIRDHLDVTQNLIDVVRLADRYQVNKLRSMCIRVIKRQLSKHNVLQILDTILIDDASLQRVHYLQDHTQIAQMCFKTLIQFDLEVFNKLNQSNEEIPQTQLAQPSLNLWKFLFTQHEFLLQDNLIFDAMVEWAKSKCEKPEAIRVLLQDVIPVIRFKTLSIKQLSSSARYLLSDDVLMTYIAAVADSPVLKQFDECSLQAMSAVATVRCRRYQLLPPLLPQASAGPNRKGVLEFIGTGGVHLFGESQEFRNPIITSLVKVHAKTPATGVVSSIGYPLNSPDCKQLYWSGKDHYIVLDFSNMFAVVPTHFALRAGDTTDSIVNWVFEAYTGENKFDAYIASKFDVHKPNCADWTVLYQVTDSTVATFTEPYQVQMFAIPQRIVTAHTSAQKRSDYSQFRLRSLSCSYPLQGCKYFLPVSRIELFGTLIQYQEIGAMSGRMSEKINPPATTTTVQENSSDSSSDSD